MIKKIKAKDVDDLASYYGGKCIYKNYKNNKTKLKWECNIRHIWESTPDSVRRERWCPFCSGNTAKDIKDMHIR